MGGFGKASIIIESQVENIQNEYADNDKVKVNNSRSRSTRQTISRMRKNSNNSLLSKVCTDDVQCNNGNFTIKSFSSEDETVPKLSF